MRIAAAVAVLAASGLMGADGLRPSVVDAAKSGDKAALRALIARKAEIGRAHV